MRSCLQAGVTVILDGEIYNIAPEAAHKFFREEVLQKIKRDCPF
jgi:hypothetical protein